MCRADVLLIFVTSFLGHICVPSQINVGEKVDRVQAIGYHESSADVLEDEAIESALVLTTVSLNQVP